MNTLFRNGMASVLWLVATSVGAETLAMTVKYDQGDVGEEHQVWTTQYFTDDQNRLVRKVQVVRGEFVGDPDVSYETVYRWDATGVRWESIRFDGVTEERTILLGDQSVERTIATKDAQSSNGTTLRRILRYLDPECTSWTDGERVSKWTATSGYEERPTSTDASQLQSPSGWTTSGALLVEWFRGNENNRVILDRRPDRILGTFAQANLNLTGWNVTGQLEVSGRGLWHRDALVRLAHMSILHDDWNLAWVAPLVWTSGYLR